jgi:hypothetical protein
MATGQHLKNLSFFSKMAFYSFKNPWDILTYLFYRYSSTKSNSVFASQCLVNFFDEFSQIFVIGGVNRPYSMLIAEVEGLLSAKH